MGIRVYQLAKELNLSSKELIEKLAEMDIQVKAHTSSLDEKTCDLLKAKFGKQEQAKVEEPKKEEVETKEEASKEEVVEIKTEEPKKEEKPKQEIKSDSKQKNKNKKKKSSEKTEELKELEIKIPITVGELANEIGAKANEIIKALMEQNIFASINQSLDAKIVSKVLASKGYKLKEVEEEAIEEAAEKIMEEMIEESDVKEDPSLLQSRSPVITLMGHVDHGKTSLLDAIRKANVVDKEHGGITQHIGAYEVFLEKQRIVFVDTPGHAAFTEMRARGANVTDIVIVVIAADDGVMPQTIEAINHAKAAGVPIVIAVNKVDKPGADPDRVRTQLTEYELVPEEWGGKTIFVNVSAITGEGVQALLEMILLESEMLELKANPDKKAKGVVIEGHISKDRGVIATVLVQEGTLNCGDIVVAGGNCGKVRALINDKGVNVKSAMPATPVEILGLNGVPNAGNKLFVAESEKQARDFCDKYTFQKREHRLMSKPKKATLEELYTQLIGGEVKELNLILKADVTGSLEVLNDSLLKLSTEKVNVVIIHEGVGAITESDVMLASASDAIVVGFHVRPEIKAESMAENEAVEIRLYRVIYELVDDIRKAMEGLLGFKKLEVEQGKVEIRDLFKVSRIGNIAGCHVIKGKIARTSNVRVVRDGVEIYDGILSSLKRVKDDAKEVLEGFDCGIVVEKFNDIKVGDIIEAYTFKEEKETL
jgi:translation initiation factor IF-2